MKERIKNIRLLTKLFFIRFFRNESMPFENESEAKLISMLSIISVLGLFFSYNLLFHYIFVPENGNSWNEKSHLILIFMLVIGFITLLEWEILLPDRDDYMVLTPLPLSSIDIFVSKFMSFILFVGLFAFSANLLSAFFFPIFLSGFYNTASPFFFIRFSLVHLIVSFFANILIFFILLSLKGLLMVILPLKIHKRISLVLQGILMIGVLSVYAFIPKMYAILPELMKKGDKKILYYPQMWFTGLYEYFLGRKTVIFKELSKYAIYSLLIGFVVSLLIFTLSYVKHMKNTGTILNIKRINRKPVYEFFKKMFDKILLRDSTERAIFYFMNKTLRRSSKHRIKLFGFLAVAIAVIISKFVTEQSMPQYIKEIGEWHKIVYSLPFIIWFFLLIGLRVIANNPAYPASNWVFKLTEKKDKSVYRRGIHKNIILQIILPFVIFFFIFYMFIWGVEKSVIFNLYSFLISFLMEEILFFNIKKIPYTCISLPDKSNLKILFVLYILIFISYVLITGYFGYWLVKVPSLLKNFIYFAMGALAILFFIKKHFEKKDFDLVFEEEEEEVMLNFHPIKY